MTTTSHSTASSLVELRRRRDALHVARTLGAHRQGAVAAADVAVHLRVVEVRDLERRGQHAHHGAARDVAGAPALEQRQHLLRRQRRQRRAMPRHRPRIERQQHGAIAAPHRRRRHRQEVIDLLDGARAAAGEVAPLGHGRARHGEQRSALTPRQQRRTRAFVTQPGSDLVEHDSTLSILVGPFNRKSTAYGLWTTESFAVTSVCGGLRLTFLCHGLVPSSITCTS